MLFGSTFVGYLCGRLLDQSQAPGRRRLLVTISIVANLSSWRFSSTFNFFVDSLVTALHGVGVQDAHVAALRIVLPPGISFYTFQGSPTSSTCTIGRLEPAESICRLCPVHQPVSPLVAGPIQRPFASPSAGAETHGVRSRAVLSAA